MIKSTMVPCGNEILKCDTIEHEGMLWLVPEWRHNTKEGWMQPARIVRITGLPLQETTGADFGDYILNVPIPKSILDGNPPDAEAALFQVIEQPDIRLPSGGLH